MHRWICAAAAGVSLCACPPSACGPGSCFGCCDVTGQCVSPTETACGINGAQCVSCAAAQTCSVRGECLSGGSGGGGSGGGSGGGGAGGSGGAGGACVLLAQSCASNACCSGVCSGGHCA